MTDIAELVGRLRRWAAFGYGVEASRTMREAADALVAQQARIAELQQFHDWAEPQIARPVEQSVVDEINRVTEQRDALLQHARPGLLDGIQHDVDCACLHAPASHTMRRACDCGAVAPALKGAAEASRPMCKHGYTPRTDCPECGPRPTLEEAEKWLRWYASSPSTNAPVNVDKGEGCAVILLAELDRLRKVEK